MSKQQFHLSRATQQFLIKARDSLQNNNNLSTKQIKSLKISLELEIKRLKKIINQYQANNNTRSKQYESKASMIQCNDNILTLTVLHKQLNFIQQLSVKTKSVQKSPNIQGQNLSNSNVKKSKIMQNLSISRAQKSSIYLSFQQLSNIKTIAILIKNEQYKHAASQINNFIKNYIQNQKKDVQDIQNTNLQLIKEYFYLPILKILQKQTSFQKEIQTKTNTLIQLNQIIQNINLSLSYQQYDQIQKMIQKINSHKRSIQQKNLDFLKINNLMNQIINHKNSLNQIINQKQIRLKNVQEQLQNTVIELQRFRPLISEYQKIRIQLQQDKKYIIQQNSKIQKLQKKLLLAQAKNKQYGLNEKQLELQTQVITNLQSKLQQQKRDKQRKNISTQKSLKQLLVKQQNLVNQIKIYERQCEQMVKKTKKLQQKIFNYEKSQQQKDLKQSKLKKRLFVSQNVKKLIEEITSKLVKNQPWIQVLKKIKIKNNQEKQFSEQVKKFLQQISFKQQNLLNIIQGLQNFKQQSSLKIKLFKQKVEQDFIQAKFKINSPKSINSHKEGGISFKIIKSLKKQVLNQNQNNEYFQDSETIFDKLINDFRIKYDEMTTDLFQSNAWVYIQTIQISQFLNDQQLLIQALKFTKQKFDQYYLHQNKGKNLSKIKRKQPEQALIQIYDKNLKQKKLKQLTLLELEFKNFLQNSLFLIQNKQRNKNEIKINELSQQINKTIQKNKSLQKLNNQIYHQKHNLQKEIRILLNQNNQYDIKNKQLFKKVTYLSQSLKKYEKQQKDLIQALQKQAMQVRSSQNQNANLKKQVITKQKQNQQLKKRNSQIILQNNSLIKKLKQMQKQVKKFQNQTKNVKNKLMSIQENINNKIIIQKELINQKNILQKKLNLQTNQSQNLRKIINQLQKQLKDYAQYTSKMVQNKLFYQQELNTLRYQQQKRRKQLQQSKSKIQQQSSLKTISQSKIITSSQNLDQQQYILKQTKKSDSLIYSNLTNRSNISQRKLKQKQKQKDQQTSFIKYKQRQTLDYIRQIHNVGQSTKQMLLRLKQNQQRQKNVIQALKEWISQNQISLENNKQRQRVSRESSILCNQKKRSSNKNLYRDKKILQQIYKTPFLDQILKLVQNFSNKKNNWYQNKIRKLQNKNLDLEKSLEELQILKQTQKQLKKEIILLKSEEKQKLSIKKQFQIYLKKTQKQIHERKAQISSLKDQLKENQRQIKNFKNQNQSFKITINSFENRVKYFERQTFEKQQIIKEKTQNLILSKNSNIQLETINKGYKNQLKKAEQFIEKYQRNIQTLQTQKNIFQKQLQIATKQNKEFSTKTKETQLLRISLQDLIHKFRLKLYKSFYYVKKCQDVENNEQQRSNKSAFQQSFEKSLKQFSKHYPNHQFCLFIKEFELQRSAIYAKIQNQQNFQRKIEKDLSEILSMVRFDNSWINNKFFINAFKQIQQQPKQIQPQQKLRNNHKVKQVNDFTQISLINLQNTPIESQIFQLLSILWRTAIDSSKRLQKNQIFQNQARKTQIILQKYILKEKNMLKLQNQLKKQTKILVNNNQYLPYVIQEIQTLFKEFKSDDSSFISILQIILSLIKSVETFMQKKLKEKQFQLSKYLQQNQIQYKNLQLQKTEQSTNKISQINKIQQLQEKLNILLKQAEEIEKQNKQLEIINNLKQKQIIDLKILNQNINLKNVKIQGENKQKKYQLSKAKKQFQIIFKQYQKLKSLYERDQIELSNIQVLFLQKKILAETLQSQLQNVTKKYQQIQSNKEYNEIIERQNEFVRRIKEEKMIKLQSQSKQKTNLLRKLHKQKQQNQIQIIKLRQQLDQSLERQKKIDQVRKQSIQKIQSKNLQLSSNIIKQKESYMKTISALKKQKKEADYQLQIRNMQNQKYISLNKKQQQMFHKCVQERDKQIKFLKEKLNNQELYSNKKYKQLQMQISQLKDQYLKIIKQHQFFFNSKQSQLEQAQKDLYLFKQMLKEKDQENISQKESYYNLNLNDLKYDSFRNSIQVLNSQLYQNQNSQTILSKENLQLKGIIDKNQQSFYKLQHQNDKLIRDCKLLQQKVINLNSTIFTQKNMLEFYENQLKKGTSFKNNSNVYHNTYYTYQTINSKYVPSINQSPKVNNFESTIVKQRKLSVNPSIENFHEKTIQSIPINRNYIKIDQDKNQKSKQKHNQLSRINSKNKFDLISTFQVNNNNDSKLQHKGLEK